MAKLFLNLEEQLHGHQRVSAEIKEVVLTADPFDAECLSPEGCEGGFDRRPRRLEDAAQRRPIPFWRRQGLPVDLHVRRLGKRAQFHHTRRHHVLRQLALRIVPEYMSVWLLALARDHISDEPPVPGHVFAEDDNRRAHRGMLLEHSLDLAQLDSVSANLHLLIRTALELHVSVVQVTGEVTRTIDAGVRRVGERVLDEPLRRQLRSIEIAAYNSRPANHEFTRYSHRHWLEVLVDNVQLRVCNWSADRDAVLLPVELIARGPNRGLGRTVHIDDAALEHAAQFRCE